MKREDQKRNKELEKKYKANDEGMPQKVQAAEVEKEGLYAVDYKRGYDLRNYAISWDS